MGAEPLGAVEVKGTGDVPAALPEVADAVGAGPTVDTPGSLGKKKGSKLLKLPRFFSGKKTVRVDAY